jgi:hypothetical protein
MGMMMNQLITLLIGQGQKWIRQQREAFRPRGRELPESNLADLAKYFDPDLLKGVRTVAVPAIENPPFLAQFGSALSLARVPMLDFSTMAALTLIDTVLITPAVPPGEMDSLVFHELVHVVQYDLLGLDKFVELFVSGWVNQGFNYAAIPLEMDAYELQYQYEGDPESGFDVRDEVSRRLELLLED